MSEPIITEAKLEGALTYLASTDELFGECKAGVERAEILRKRCRARHFLLASGNNEERKAQAEIAQEVQDSDDLYCKSVEQFEKLKATRERADIVVNVWRSLEASRRKT